LIRNSTLLLLVFLYASAGLYAQDTHFSQFYASPLTLNPALTGISDGSYRVSGIYRNQDRSFTTPYITYSGAFDIKLLQNLLKNDIFAIGAVFLGDRSGDGVLAMNNVMLSASYHKSIGKAHKHFIGIGVQGGYTQKSVNWNKLSFPDQNAGDFFDLTKPNNEAIAKGQVSYFDLNAGLLYQGWIKKDEDGIFAGVSFAHLTSPKESFYSENDKLPIRYTAHAGAYVKLSKHFFLTPNVLFLYQNKALETNLGTAVEYHVDVKKSQFVAFIGAWDRINDAFITSAGIEYYKVRLSFAYDITTSSLTYATENRSAFELAIVYTGFIKSKDVQYPKLVPCPRM
jgi:type IX secretion system PorP/SprF family membrane protein